MSEHPKVAPRRTRFARLYPDGGMNVMPDTSDFVRARRELIQGGDDDDVELLEVEVTVVRTHGRPKMSIVQDYSARCSCCGETVFIEVPTDEMVRPGSKRQPKRRENGSCFACGGTPWLCSCGPDRPMEEPEAARPGATQ